MNKERLQKLITDLKALEDEHRDKAFRLQQSSNEPTSHSYHRGQADAYENVLLVLDTITSMNEA